MEKRLYHGIVGLLLLALAGFGWFAWTKETHGAWRGAHFSQVGFGLAMAVSIPGTILFMALLRLILGGSKGRIFWIKHPARTVAHETAEPPEAVLERTRQRLAGLGFVAEEGAAGGTEPRLVFAKPKAATVARFVDHALAAEVTVGRENHRTRTVVTVIFKDIILVDSGELARLDKVAGYLAGVSDGLDVSTLPFTMLCGIVLALVNLALWPVASLRGWLLTQQYGIGFGAAALILVGGYTIVRHRRENYGVLPGALGLVAALAPLLAG